MAGANVTRVPELRASLGDPRFVLIVLGTIVLAVFPYFGYVWGETYLVSLVAKMLIFAIAAVSLDLLIGYGGMVSFGHAAYIGLGAYGVAVFSKFGIDNGYLQLVCSVAGSAFIALFIGAISLRTSGVYFIMITLAFAQMLYYLANSVKAYGGDEGLNIRARSVLGFGLDLKHGPLLWWLTLALLALAVLGLARLAPSRLGRALLALRDDELRAAAGGGMRVDVAQHDVGIERLLQDRCQGDSVRAGGVRHDPDEDLHSSPSTIGSCGSGAQDSSSPRASRERRKP